MCETLRRIACNFRESLLEWVASTKERIPVTPNQIVAHNLRRARLSKDWTLEETTERLSRHLGEKWTQATLSSAEGSRHGKRIRKFDADQLVAFADCFEVPVGFFFESPEATVHTLWHSSVSERSDTQEDIAVLFRRMAELFERRER
jgi:hypothetical protein